MHYLPGEPILLTSLFGDLAPRRLPPITAAVSESESESLFPETMVMEDSEHAELVMGAASNSIDVLVEASPAQAIRDHFANTRADLDLAAPMITLLDPTRLWAPQVLASLVHASVQPSERLNLRDRATLRTLAMIERATVSTPKGERLKVYHADIRTQGAEDDEVGHVLAERSHMSVVIIGALQANAVASMVRRLVSVTRDPGWRCPWLVFVLPPGAAPLRHRLLGQEWPEHVHISIINESMMGGPTQLWNAILDAWKDRDSGIAPAAGLTLAERQRASNSSRGSAAMRALTYLTSTDGLLACGVIDATRNEVLAFESVDMTQSDLSCIARALIAARNAHARVAEAIGSRSDELLISVGPMTQLLRTCSASQGLVIVAVIDRNRVSLPQLRFKLLEAEKQLG
jgi:hypothetical protein